MSIVNKRNAVVGWLVVKAGKAFAKQKAANAVPSKRTGGAVAAAVATAAGVLLFWRKRGDDGSEE